MTNRARAPTTSRAARAVTTATAARVCGLVAVCAALALVVPVRAQQSKAMKVVMSSSTYLSFWHNGNPQTLTDPYNNAQTDFCRNHLGTAKCLAPNSLSPLMCCSCPYVTELSEANYADVFAVKATYVRADSRADGQINANMASWIGQLQWQFNGFVYNTDQTWLCRSMPAGQAPPNDVNGRAWNQKFYLATNNQFVTATQFGSIPSDNWGYGSYITYQLSLTAPRPNWIWTADGNTNTPANPDVYCIWSLPSAAPELATVDGYRFGNAYSGYIDNYAHVVYVSVGAYVTSLQLNATMIDHGMRCGWNNAPIASQTLSGCSVTMALAAAGSPNTNTIATTSLDGQTVLSYQVIVVRLPAAWEQTNRWSAEGSAIDNYCTGVADGTTQGGVQYVSPGLGGSGRAWSFDGTTGYVNVNNAAARPLWFHVGGDLRVQVGVKFTQQPTGGDCTAANWGQPFVAASEGTSANQNRFVFGYCNGGFAVLYNTVKVGVGAETLVGPFTWSPPQLGVWYTVLYERIDYVWRVTVNGAQVGSPQLRMTVMSQPPVALQFARFGARYFQGQLDEITFWRGSWVPMAKVDGTMYVAASNAAMIANGVNTPGFYEYIEPCNQFNFLGTGAAVTMRLTMLGAPEPNNIVEYFQPANGLSLCTMLQNSNSHRWSRTATGPFVAPAYINSGTDLGGSAAGYPGTTGTGDNRQHLSFWGRASGGGCCAATNTAAVAFYQEYAMSVRAPTCPLVSPCYLNGVCAATGTCVLVGTAPTSSFRCDCQAGYEGATCATVTNNCAANPCLNGGTCTNAVATYSCQCTGGATGLRCETLPPSTLSNLVVVGSSPISYTGNVYMYTSTCTTSVSAITVVATTTDPAGQAQIGINAPQTGTSSRSVTLNYGDVTFIPIVAYGSIAGTQPTGYNITVTQTLSTVATLASFTCAPWPLTLDGSTYATTVQPLNTSITCTATTTDPKAKVSLNGLPATVGTTGPVPLAPLTSDSDTSFSLTVWSEYVAFHGGNVASWTLLVTRPLSTETRLRALTVLDNFGRVVLPASEYPADSQPLTVDHDVTSLTLLATLEDATATMDIDGVPLSSGVSSSPLVLPRPSNVAFGVNRQIVVTAQNTGFKRTYTFAVTIQAIPTVVANTPCVTVAAPTVPQLLVGHTRSLYITVPAGQDYEFLHVAATSDSMQAPVSLFLRHTTLPDLLARTYDVASVTTAGAFSHVTLANLNAATFYLSYQIPASAPNTVTAIATTFDVCAYRATPLDLAVASPNTAIKANGWAMFSYTLLAGQVFGGVSGVLRTVVPDPIATPFLKVYAALNPRVGAPQQDIDVAKGLLQTDTNPITGASTTPTEATTGDYQATARILSPASGLRVVFFVFADPDVPAALPQYTVTMTALPPLPVVTSIYPTTSSQLGLIALTISGTNFEPLGALLQGGFGRVLLGGPNGKNCTNPTYTNQRQILCLVPPGVAGSQPHVSVLLYGRRSHETPVDLFKYESSCTQVPDTSEGAPPGATTCFQCKPGTYSIAALTTFCGNCSAGTFAFGYAQSVCSDCGPGTYAPSIASSICSLCSAGSATDDTGSVTCPVCTAGKYSPADGLVVCPDCDAGSYSGAGNATACTLCAPGSVQPTPGQSSCTPCDAGSSMPVNGGSTCLPCTGGTFANTTGLPNCYTCPAGRFAPPGASGCTDCAKGRFTATSGQASCLFCGPGTFGAATGQTSCSPCAAGTASAGQGTQDACPACLAGSVAVVAGQIQCVQCAPGSASFGTSPAQPCPRCPAGQYQPYPGQFDCLPCGTGKYFNTTGAIACDLCPVGRVQAAQGMGYCDACPTGYVQPQPGKTECEACGPGTVQPSQGQLVCTPCPAGYWSDAYNATQCIPCDVGKSSTPGSSACMACDRGRYAASTASIECAPCDRGLFQNVSSATFCYSCPAGAINIVDGSSSCFGCSVGTYQPNAGTTRCLSCDPGFYNAFTNQTVCQQCGPATFSGVGQAQCTNCTVGRASTASGARVCPPCAEGSYQNLPGQQFCVPCPLGTAQNAPESTACTPCGPGSFAGSLGQHMCTPCPAGSSMTGSGATICSLCSVGTYQPGTGAQTCQACPIGTSINVTGVQQCEACPVGSSNPQERQVTCRLCAPGYAAAASGASECAACPVGTYSTSEGTVTCLPCGAGTYNDQPAAGECPQCRAGTFQSQPLQTTCVSCEPGSFSSAGATTCSPCGDRQIAALSGASTCYSCDANAVADISRTKCECGIDYAGVVANTSDASGQSTIVCQRCPRGAVCNAQGTMWATMQTASGWWSPVTGVYYQCLVPTQCVGGAVSGSIDQCQAHYTGPMCSYCLEGYSQSVDGKCNACSSGTNSEYYTAIVIVLFLAAIILLLWILVRSGDRLMEIAFLEEERLEREAAGFVTENTKEYGELMMARNRHGNIITLRGAPAPYPDFTFKLKILLGFLQVITNLSFGLSIQWPPTFAAFINWFNPANLDFIRFSSVDCLNTWTYYDKVLLFVFAPPICFVVLLLGYFVPMNIHISCCGAGRNPPPAPETVAKPTLSDTDLAVNPAYAAAAEAYATHRRAVARERKRTRRNFWKMLMFALFLLYPTVSATILRMYICVEVEGTSYLVADLRTVCHDATHDRATYLGLPAIALYPIGIPLFFFFMIFRYRNRLEEAGVRAQLGFIYDAYEHRWWWFEMADMLYKLAVTSAVAFLPQNAQLQAAMGVVWLYLATVLVTRPFLRKGDDQLLGFALVEIILLLEAGLTFNSMDSYSRTYDILMSIVLIAVVGLFVVYFVASAGAVLRKLVRNSDWGKARGWKSSLDSAKKGIGRGGKRDGTLEAEMARMTVDRRTLLRKSGGGGAASNRLKHEHMDHADVLHTRNPVFDPQSAGATSPRSSIAQTLNHPAAATPGRKSSAAAPSSSFGFGVLTDPGSPTNAGGNASAAASPTHAGTEMVSLTAAAHNVAPQAAAPAPAPAAADVAVTIAPVDGAAAAAPVPEPQPEPAPAAAAPADAAAPVDPVQVQPVLLDFSAAPDATTAVAGDAQPPLPFDPLAASAAAPLPPLPVEQPQPLPVVDSPDALTLAAAESAPAPVADAPVDAPVPAAADAPAADAPADAAPADAPADASADAPQQL